MSACACRQLDVFEFTVCIIYVLRTLASELSARLTLTSDYLKHFSSCNISQNRTEITNLNEQTNHHKNRITTTHKSLSHPLSATPSEDRMANVPHV